MTIARMFNSVSICQSKCYSHSEPASGSHQHQTPGLPALSTELTDPLLLRGPFQNGSGLHRSFENRRFS